MCAVSWCLMTSSDIEDILSGLKPLSHHGEKKAQLKAALLKNQRQINSCIDNGVSLTQIFEGLHSAGAISCSKTFFFVVCREVFDSKPRKKRKTKKSAPQVQTPVSAAPAPKASPVRAEAPKPKKPMNPQKEKEVAPKEKTATSNQTECESDFDSLMAIFAAAEIKPVKPKN